MFENTEYRSGAFAGIVAVVLVIALTAMAFNALEPDRDAARNDWVVSLSEPDTTVAPTF